MIDHIKDHPQKWAPVLGYYKLRSAWAISSNDGLLRLFLPNQLDIIEKSGFLVEGGKVMRP